MNIYALAGHRVTCTKKSIKAGYASDRANAEKHLEPGTVYTVSRTDVGQSSTRVYLDEFGQGVGFNSVHFQDVEKQPENLDKEHPEYHQWN